MRGLAGDHYGNLNDKASFTGTPRVVQLASKRSDHGSRHKQAQAGGRRPGLKRLKKKFGRRNPGPIVGKAYHGEIAQSVGRDAEASVRKAAQNPQAILSEIQKHLQ